MKTKQVYICYRHPDNGGCIPNINIVRSIVQQIKLISPCYKVVISEPKFSEITSKQIESSNYFICILTHDTLHKCNTPTDPVRQEISLAHKYGVKFIYINPDNQFNNDCYPVDFPKELDFIKTNHHITIHMDSSFERDMKALAKNELGWIDISNKSIFYIMIITFICLAITFFLHWKWGLLTYILGIGFWGYFLSSSND